MCITSYIGSRRCKHLGVLGKPIPNCSVNGGTTALKNTRPFQILLEPTAADHGQNVGTSTALSNLLSNEHAMHLIATLILTKDWCWHSEKKYPPFQKYNYWSTLFRYQKFAVNMLCLVPEVNPGPILITPVYTCVPDSWPYKHNIWHTIFQAQCFPQLRTVPYQKQTPKL